MNNIAAKTSNEVLCGFDIFPIIKYLEELLGYNTMCNIVEPLGFPISYLNKKTNYVSMNYYVTLVEKLIEITEDDKAPYKVFTNLQPKVFLNEIVYSSYSSNIFRSLKLGYKFFLNLIIHNKISKICNYEILPSGNNSLIIKSKSKMDDKFCKYYNLSFNGFLLALLNALDLKKSKITKKTCNDLDDKELVFKIVWKNKRESARKKEKEINDALIHSIQELENNHRKEILRSIELNEKNKYLYVSNKIRKLINNEIYFSPVLFEILRILIEEFNFKCGYYYQLDSKKNVYTLNFELSNNKLSYKKEKIDDVFLNKEYSLDEYKSFKKNGYKIKYENFLNCILTDQIIASHEEYVKESCFYMIPTEISEIHSGFFLLFAEKNFDFSYTIINELINDIIEQLKIGYKKISSRNIINNILSAIPANVLIFDTNNLKIKYVNNIFISSFPDISKTSTKDDIIDKELFAIVPFNNNGKKIIIDFINNKTKKINSEKSEIKIGSNLFEHNLFMIPHEKEAESLAGIIMTDITDTKYFQQQLILNEKLIALGKVASGVAHEINNPLYAILAYAEQMSEDEKTSNESKELAEKIIDYVMNISNIIKDLSIYSKTLRREEVDEVNINEIVEESLKLIQYSSNIFNIKIIKKLDANIPPIKIRKGELQQIIINLINNSIQSLEDKGSVTINTKLLGKEVEISIADTGCGIKKEDQEHIFDLYFTTKKAGEGTGQGLHIVKRIIENYKGKITFESKPGKGTTFFIKFKIP